MRIACFALLVLLLPGSGLAAQPPIPPTSYAPWQRNTPTRLAAFGPTTWIRMDTVPTWVIVHAGPGEVYRKTRHVYETLKLKVPLTDTLGGLLGNPGFNHTGALAGRRMSSWISCGEGLAGPNADTWRITMAVISWVEPVAKDTTRLRTMVTASARNLAEGSRTPMPCVTTGQMEAEIHKKVQAMPPAPSGNE